MTCPFLKEAQVKFCQTATVRKLIPLALAGKTDEKCSTPAFVTCPIYRAHPEAQAASGPCPYLRESLMQYCGAAPVAKFVPYSESLLSRCGNDSFRYCELYLAIAHPARRGDETEGIQLPAWLQYSGNHMWLDITDDGVCHAGIDAFLSRALGTIDRVSYVWMKGRHRPTAVLSAGGLDVEVMFPTPMLLTNCNLYLRADPSRLTSEPYTGGWLFEGVPLPETTEGLLSGEKARGWMESEQQRINELLQQAQNPGTDSRGKPIKQMADGGLFAAGLAHLLPRDQMRALIHEFFSPFASGK
jgi:glycine cleavage system H lipoate-binding protein